MTAVSPVTKTARHAQIATILEHHPVRSQEELAGLLGRRGIHVTQATLSRDLEELGAVRLRRADGVLVYALPGEPGGPGSRPGGPGHPDQAAVRSGARYEDQGPADSMTTAGRVTGAGGAKGTGHGRLRVQGTGGAAPVDPPGVRQRVPSSFGGLAHVAGELLVSAEASANLVVLRTPAGGAQLLASAIDHADWPAVLGTVAGDDTVLVITRDPAGGDGLARQLLRLAERRR